MSITDTECDQTAITNMAKGSVNIEMVHEEVEHRAPKEILANLARLEVEIQQGMENLEALLK